MASALAMAACGPKQQVATVPAIDLANLDTTVSPAVDFYQYSTGGWQKNNPLKPEYARFGSFDQLRENNVKRLNDLFAEMGTLKTEKGTVEQKISDLYKQGLDSTRLNAEGAAPLKNHVDEIYAAADKDALVKIIAGLHDVSESSFFGAYVMSDLADSDNQILYLGQGGLGIGDRDYYVEAENAAIKEGYRNFLAKIFTLTGVAEPEKACRQCSRGRGCPRRQLLDQRSGKEYPGSVQPLQHRGTHQKLPRLRLETLFRDQRNRRPAETYRQRAFVLQGFLRIFRRS